MNSEELREKFIKFFEEKEHKVLPSSSLIPEDDPSVLLTTSGMQQFKKWFAGFEKPAHKRVVTIQKCVRIDDIDEVGDNTHFSFFEMFGNFSFGDYFKEDTIKWGLEFMRDELNISFDRISFSYFKGDEKIPKDEESHEVLKNLEILDDKIKALGKKDNFWGPTGDEGPCGPTVEIFVDGIEVWNLVFNEYIRTKDGEYKQLEEKGVDTGLGFERTLAVVNGKDNIYDTDLFNETLEEVKKLAKSEDEHSVRVIMDHLRAATFLLADGVLPSNLDKGYVLRRLIRRAIRHGRVIGIEKVFCSKIAEIVIKRFGNIYQELSYNKENIIEELDKETEKFEKTLENGLKQFNKISDNKVVSGKEAFDLFQTYGFPFEITEELAREKRIKVDRKSYEREFEKHQEASRKGADKKFKGGLASGGEMETKYHTATHLLNQALKMVLGDHVKQSGSNITEDRLRFDFTHPEKMTPEEKTEVEKIVNAEINKGLEIKCEEMSLDNAKKSGAVGIFDSKYGDKVKVYSMGDFSKEICGGPHVKNTSELGKFRIKKEGSSSAGVRRIKAILE